VPVLHLHASHAVERVRRDHSRTPHVDLCSVWIFAGALVLPVIAETALVVLIYTHRWLLVGRWDPSRPPHKTVFTAAMMTTAALSAVAVSQLSGLRHDLSALGSGVKPGWLDFGALVGAVGAQWTVNTLLVAGVILLTARLTSKREALGSGPDNLLEICQLALGAFVALSLLWWPPLTVLMVVPTVVVHRTVLFHQLQLAARTDRRTGLLDAIAWQEQAEATLRRVLDENSAMAVLLIDLDEFKLVNDSHGHLIGDEVLRRFAEMLGTTVQG
jgi:hypothetical protein